MSLSQASKSFVDVLMIAYNRPNYTRLALARLLETADEQTRVWLWQNGSDNATMRAVEPFLEHPRLHQYHHSPVNQKLTAPTNWVWEQADGEFVSKVDDDCLMPDDWVQTLRRAHHDEPKFGVLGCWRFFDEDFVAELANKKICSYPGGHRIMRNCWVEGSGYLMKRDCIRQAGPLTARDSFPSYCVGLAKQDWIHGWYYPFLFQEHMDDPRSQHCEIQSDEDLRQRPPLMAIRWGTKTRDDYIKRFQNEAVLLQSAKFDPKYFGGWRNFLRKASANIARRFSGLHVDHIR